MRGTYNKVFVWGFRTDWATKERGLCENPRRQILSCTDWANDVNKEFYYMAFGWFSFPFLNEFSSSDVAFYLTSSLVRSASCFHQSNIHLSNFYAITALYKSSYSVLVHFVARNCSMQILNSQKISLRSARKSSRQNLPVRSNIVNYRTVQQPISMRNFAYGP